MKFPCTECGLCCVRIKEIVEKNDVTNPEHPFYFPYTWDENGACDKLDGNKCSIYEDRPIICNVDKVAEFIGESKEEFYPKVIESCNEEMDKAGIDKKFRIR